MSTIRELHNQAMRLAQLALVARNSNELEKAESLASDAWKLEADAADIVTEDQASEPTRSILYRSAASLAFQAKEYPIAQRLIAKGLAGYPPPTIEQELHDLYEQLNYERHLQTRGIILGDEEIQLSLQGASVGFGMVTYEEFENRLKTTHTLVQRTAQRKIGVKYITSGAPPKTARPFSTIITVPRPNSFAITIRLGLSQPNQLSLLVKPAQVIDDIIKGVELINNGDEQGLREIIQDESYYRNFLSLIKDMAPDGERINMVGFTSSNQAVGLTRLRSKIELVPKIEKKDEQRKQVQISGILDYATARKRESLGITSDDGIEFTIVAQEGFEDLVHSYFKEHVTIIGFLNQKKREIQLLDLQHSDE